MELVLLCNWAFTAFHNNDFAEHLTCVHVITIRNDMAYLSQNEGIWRRRKVPAVLEKT